MEYLPHNHLIVFSIRQDGTGTDNMSVNGSSTPVDFWYEVPAGFNFLWYRGMFVIEDSAKVFNATEFGPIPALANGVKGYIDTLKTSLEITAGIGALMTNADFARFAGVDVNPIADGRGLAVRWTLSAVGGGRPVLLQSGWKFRMEVNDNLSTISKINTTIQGFLIDSRKPLTNITKV